MKKEYLTPSIESYQLNLAVGIMSPTPHGGAEQGTPSEYDAPARHVGPAGL